MTDEEIANEILSVYYADAGLAMPNESDVKVYVHREDSPYQPASITRTMVLSDGSMCFLTSRLPAMQLAYDAFVWTKT